MQTFGDNVPISRRSLLEAGQRVVLQQSREVLARGVTAALVSKQAKLARRTFYDHFETMGVFLDELAVYTEHQLLHAVPITTIGLADTDGDLREAIHRVVATSAEHRAVVDALTEVLARLGRDEVSAPDARPWRQVIDDLLSIGLHPVGGWTALGVELAIDRHARSEVERAKLNSVDVEAGPAGSLEPLFYALFRPLADDDDDPAPEARRGQVSSLWFETKLALDVPNIERLVVDAAEQLVATKGIRGLSLDAVREMTGLSRSTVTRFVGDVPALLDAIVDKYTPGLTVQLGRARSRLEPREALREHLQRSCSLWGERPGYARAVNAVMELEAFEGRPSGSTGLAALRETVTELAGDREFAEMITHLLLAPPTSMDSALTSLAVDRLLTDRT